MSIANIGNMYFSTHHQHRPQQAQLTQNFSRLWTLHSGRWMIVSDLHGDWYAYHKYKERFAQLYAAGECDGLIFMGDLVHRTPDGKPDRSVDIIVDLHQTISNSSAPIIVMCGNHELPHLYHFILSKGAITYTPALEHAFNEQPHARQLFRELFCPAPFYLRTAGGVTIAHAGAPTFAGNRERMRSIIEFDHGELLGRARAKLANENIDRLRHGYTTLQRAPSYDYLAQKYTAVHSNADPRYNDLLLGFIVSSFPEFDQLWDALFTKCEHMHGHAANQMYTQALLNAVSFDGLNQHTLVSGHITVYDGHELVSSVQLRIASWTHASPNNAGQYLLLDAKQPIYEAADLLPYLASLF